MADEEQMIITADPGSEQVVEIHLSSATERMNDFNARTQGKSYLHLTVQEQEELSDIVNEVHYESPEKALQFLNPFLNEKQRPTDVLADRLRPALRIAGLMHIQEEDLPKIATELKGYDDRGRKEDRKRKKRSYGWVKNKKVPSQPRA